MSVRGAGGNFCDLGQVVNGNLGKMSGQEFQGNEVVMEDRSMSGAHPMYERPMVVEGPYAAAKNKLRADAEARKTNEVEKNRAMSANRLQMQDLQAKVAHYEASAVRTQKNLDEQNAQAVEELRRISQLAFAERDQYCARVDNDVR